MKQRVKIDTALMILVVVFSGIVYAFPQLYPQSRAFDDVMDCLGLIAIMKGCLLRMSARGHKKSISNQSEDLVTSGPYYLVRNPMYLGSYLIGAGFALLVWPWWFLIFFTILFMLRFRIQITKEESFLREKFGSRYDAYVQSTPAVFPNIARIFDVKIRDIVNWREAFSTKEKSGIALWLVLAFILELIQSAVLYGGVDFGLTAMLFLGTIMIFSLKWVVLFVLN